MSVEKNFFNTKLGQQILNDPKLFPERSTAQMLEEKLKDRPANTIGGELIQFLIQHNPKAALPYIQLLEQLYGISVTTRVANSITTAAINRRKR